jgi:hypothetical protein
VTANALLRILGVVPGQVIAFGEEEYVLSSIMDVDGFTSIPAMAFARYYR